MPPRFDPLSHTSIADALGTYITDLFVIARKTQSDNPTAIERSRVTFEALHHRVRWQIATSTVELESALPPAIPPEQLEDKTRIHPENVTRTKTKGIGKMKRKTLCHIN